MGVVIESCNASKLSLTETKETRIFENSYRKVADQWMVPYPWREGPKGLPDNRQQAMKRLEATESRLERQISTSKISTSTCFYGRTRRQTDHSSNIEAVQPPFLRWGRWWSVVEVVECGGGGGVWWRSEE